jgi:uncharacterized protein (TIGR00730 family)
MKSEPVRPDAFEDLEQSQETTEAPHRVPVAELTGIHSLAAELVAALEGVQDGDLVAQIVQSAIKLLRDQTNRGDIKLINKSLKELRYALKVFAPYRDVRKVSIFGSARTAENDPDYRQAEAFARGMVQAGWMVITGAGGGIMAAGHGGAGAEPSFGLAIRLPFEQSTNIHIAQDKKLINFKYFFTRKLMFVRAASAVVMFPGGFGTLDESFEVLTLLQTGKSVPVPIVFLDRPGGSFWTEWVDYTRHQLLERGFISRDDLHLFKVTDDAREAIAHIQHFYSNYHSLRYTRSDLVMRLHRAPTARQLQEINRLFADISEGPLRVSAALPVERDEPALAEMPRLVFRFNKRDQGRLRMLIDHLNDLPK